MKIREVIEMIGASEIYLPAIQRKFVWKHTQIEKLFDSIMRDYPIGTFLFWFLNGEKIDDYTFYKFLQNFSQKDKYINDIAPKPELKDRIIGVLDGQQRLSSMYVALQGTYAYKLPYYQKTSEKAYPERQFYLNLFYNKSKDDESDCIFNFRFLTAEEATKRDKDNLWFLVKHVLKWKKPSAVNKYYRELVNQYGDSDFSQILESRQDDVDDMLTDLWHKMTTASVINYYKIDEPDLDNILDIFVRVNSGGTVLSKSDLLFSTIVAHWEEGREKIEELITSINGKGDGFYFDNDFLMRSCLVLTDSPVLFKVGNFKQTNIKKIKKEWGNIKRAINKTVDLLSHLGFSGETITSQNAVIPIAYYLIKGGTLNKKIEGELRQYLINGFVKQVYGGQGDSVLTNIRDGLRVEKEENLYVLKKDTFSFDDVLKIKLPGSKSFKVSEENIEESLDYKKGAYCFMTLSLLYPNLKYDQVKFHQDHLHPHGIFNKSGFKKYNIPKDKWDEYLRLRDRLPNLQLLEGGENKSKNITPLNEWIYKQEVIPDKSKYMTDNYIPKTVSLEFKDFLEFYSKRREILKEKLKKMFNRSQS